MTSGDDNIRQKLHDRALLLAREETACEDQMDGIELTTFRVGEELYALETGMIRQIVPLREFTPLPSVPKFVAGIMNLRGRILSLIDLRALLELPECNDVENSRIVVLSGDGMEFGLLADSIGEVKRVRLPALQTDHILPGTACARYMLGVTAERLIVLDAHKLLNDPALLVNQ